MSFSGPGLWYATRAAGLVTLVLLTATTALGLLTAGRVSTVRWPRFLVIGLHRNISLLALVFLGLHIGTTVVDSYTSIGIQDAVIPFLSGYHRLWLGLGAIASDVLIAVSVTSALRQRIGHRLLASGALVRLPVLADRDGSRPRDRHGPVADLGLRPGGGMRRGRAASPASSVASTCSRPGGWRDDGRAW